MEQTFGRYRLLERLGEGGMAEVFKAKSFGVEGFEKVLVIKRILPKLAQHPKFVDMFVHEAKLAVRLSHANIVQVFDLGRVDQPTGDPTAYFIAMEYVAGLDLATVLSRARRMRVSIPFGLIVYIGAEVAKALDHAHRRRDEQSRPLGIVHRDISPQNMLLSWEGEVKVTDFGIAKARGRSIATRTGMVKGKLQYLAPEQLRGLPIDRRVDVFAAGVVLWEALTGKPLFRADHEAETMMLVLQKAIPPPSSLAAGLPIAMDRVCLRALERDPKKRFPSTAAFADALEDAGAGELLRAKEVGETVERLVGPTLDPLRRALRAPLQPRPEAVSPPQENATTELPTAPVRIALEAASPHESTHTRLRASDAGTEVMDPPRSPEPPPRSAPALWLVVVLLLALGLAAFWVGAKGPQPEPERSVAPTVSVEQPPVQPAVEISKPEPPPTAERSAAPAASAVVPHRPVRAAPVRPPVQDRSKPKGTAAAPFMPPDI